MDNYEQYILAVNVGSSSLKMTAYRWQDGQLQPVVDAACESIGLEIGVRTVVITGGENQSSELVIQNHGQAVSLLLEAIHPHAPLHQLAAVGHRVVFGGIKYDQPYRITPEVIADLKLLTELDPDHMPFILNVIEAMQHQLAAIPHVACFDSAFFAGLPTIAKLLPIPRRYAALGIMKHGYHGLSYSHLVAELEAENFELAHGKIVFAHLGGGASLAAIVNGKPVDTTMSFTPTSGIPMSTRSGDLDPSIARYLMTAGGLDPDRYNHMINHESGLKGISETTGDMLTLLHTESQDERAADAINMFCYNVRKAIGALSAAMGGLDAIVFSGGIGERSAVLRSRICNGLAFLEVDLDPSKNEQSSRTISKEGAIPVYVIHADEAAVIANQTMSTINH